MKLMPCKQAGGGEGQRPGQHAALVSLVEVSLVDVRSGQGFAALGCSGPRRGGLPAGGGGGRRRAACWGPRCRRSVPAGHRPLQAAGAAAGRGTSAGSRACGGVGRVSRQPGQQQGGARQQAAGGAAGWRWGSEQPGRPEGGEAGPRRWAFPWLDAAAASRQRPPCAAATARCRCNRDRDCSCGGGSPGGAERPRRAPGLQTRPTPRTIDALRLLLLLVAAQLVDLAGAHALQPPLLLLAAVAVAVALAVAVVAGEAVQEPAGGAIADVNHVPWICAPQAVRHLHKLAADLQPGGRPARSMSREQPSGAVAAAWARNGGRAKSDFRPKNEAAMAAGTKGFHLLAGAGQRPAAASHPCAAGPPSARAAGHAWPHCSCGARQAGAGSTHLDLLPRLYRVQDRGVHVINVQRAARGHTQRQDPGAKRAGSSSDGEHISAGIGWP